MICVSIGRGRHRHVIAEHRHLVEQGARLVELRLDYINGDVNLSRLLKDKPCPVIVCCRRREDGGQWTGSEESRLILLRLAIASGVDYVDLEEDIAASVPRYGKTKRIISLHDFRKTPDDLHHVHARLSAMDADIVKIATLANRPSDSLRMLRLIEKAKVPTVGICMGEMGVASRILAGKYGAPFTYATFHKERKLAPGQLSFQEMAESYRYDQINKDTRIYGVIADPIGHSLSPLLHNSSFQNAGLNCVYIPFRVPPEDLDQFLEDAPLLGIQGLSVTIPHKEAVIPKLAKTDGAVKGVGAANTILFTPEGRVGYNTDYRAAMACLEAVQQKKVDKHSIFLDRKALVLGAGGAARAIAFGLKRRGARVIIAGRTKSRADRLSQALGCDSVSWEDRHSLRAEILVNCTPVGMHPNVDESPYDSAYLNGSMIVFDTVYNPERTLLVANAREKHCNVITGVEMFVRQAAMQFHLFTEIEAPLSQLREILRRATSAVRH